MQAFINEEKFPANMAFAAYLIKTLVRVGANTESVAISIPIVPKLANPSIERANKYIFTSYLWVSLGQLSHPLFNMHINANLISKYWSCLNLLSKYLISWYWPHKAYVAITIDLSYIEKNVQIKSKSIYSYCLFFFCPTFQIMGSSWGRGSVPFRYSGRVPLAVIPSRNVMTVPSLV